MERLKEQIQWTHCVYNKKKDSYKVPAQGLGRGKCLPYEEAVQNASEEKGGSPYYGFVFQGQKDYIAFDVDVDNTGVKKDATTELPPAVFDFLDEHPTHAHYSPSGQGLHIIYRVDIETQMKLAGVKASQGKTSIEQGSIFTGDFRYSTGFLVFTNNLYEKSTEDIAYIDFDTITGLLPSLKRQNQVTFKSITPFISDTDLELLTEYLSIIPPQYDYRAKQACRNLQYTKISGAYDYWYTVGMACAYVAVLYEHVGDKEKTQTILDLYHNWSTQDEEKYIDRDDVVEKFKSFLRTTRYKIQEGRSNECVTINTLAVMARDSRANFTRTLKNGAPNPKSVENIEALFEYDGLIPVKDDILDRYGFKAPIEFMIHDNSNGRMFSPLKEYKTYRPPEFSQMMNEKQLGTFFLPYVQQGFGHTYNIGKDVANIAKELTILKAKPVNLWLEFCKSAPNKEEDLLTPVINSLTISDSVPSKYYDLCRTFIKNTLLSMVGIHMYPEDNPKTYGFLLLSGPEAIYKTSWAEWLLPPEMRPFMAKPRIDSILKSDIEWDRFLCSNVLLVINECEKLLTPKYEYKIKSSVDTEDTDYRDLYINTPDARRIKAVNIGTTNKTEFFSSDDGSRKLWHTPVTACDTMYLKSINRQNLFGHIYKTLEEYKRKNPNKLIQSAWSLTPEERELTNQFNKSKDSSDIGVRGVFSSTFGVDTDTCKTFDPQELLSTTRKGFDRHIVAKRNDLWELNSNPEKSPRFWTVPSMVEFLNINRRMPFKESDIRNELIRYAGWYTGTNRMSRKLFKDCAKKESFAYQTVVQKGSINIMKGNSTKYYIMPPILSEDSIINNEIE